MSDSEATPQNTPEGAAETPSAAPQPASPNKWRRRGKMLWREWIRPLLIIGIVMGSFRSAVADWNDVPTGSMKPTILEGDRIFINKVAYDLKFPFTTWRLAEWADPVRGDIIVLRSPEDSRRLVKRVVGVAGDKVGVQNKRLLINGQLVQWRELDTSVIEQLDPENRAEHFFHSEGIDGRWHSIMLRRSHFPHPEPPITVPDDHFFVMGDNRDNSRDSRYFGVVHRDAILGRATAVALSLDRENYLMPRWKRFFSRLD